MTVFVCDEEDIILSSRDWQDLHIFSSSFWSDNKVSFIYSIERDFLSTKRIERTLNCFSRLNCLFFPLNLDWKFMTNERNLYLLVIVSYIFFISRPTNILLYLFSRNTLKAHVGSPQYVKLLYMWEGGILPRQRLRRCDIYITSIYIGITNSAFTGRKSKTTDLMQVGSVMLYPARGLHGVTQSLWKSDLRQLVIRRLASSS